MVLNRWFAPSLSQIERDGAGRSQQLVTQMRWKTKGVREAVQADGHLECSEVPHKVFLRKRGAKKFFTRHAELFCAPFTEEHIMLKNFRTYQLAVTLYRQTAELRLPAHLADQLRRAAASAALNTAEGAGRISPKDQARFFDIAYASTKEVQAVLDLAGSTDSLAIATADSLAAHLYRLRLAMRR